MDWSKKYDKCINCGTVRFRHKSRGYCTRCYTPIKKLKDVEKWNFEKPETLISYPKEPTFQREEVFHKIKKGFNKQYNRRLDELKYNEEYLKRDITGHDLEFKIREVAKLCGVDGSLLFYGKANSFNSDFNDNQRKLLYKLLQSIIENKKWKGIDWWELFDDKD